MLCHYNLGYISFKIIKMQELEDHTVSNDFVSIDLSYDIFELFERLTLKNIVTLKSKLWSLEVIGKRHHSIERLQDFVYLPRFNIFHCSYGHILCRCRRKAR